MQLNAPRIFKLNVSISLFIKCDKLIFLFQYLFLYFFSLLQRDFTPDAMTGSSSNVPQISPKQSVFWRRLVSSSDKAGLTACWRPGWCPHASVFRPEQGLVSLGCWPEMEWAWKLCRKLNWEQRHRWRQKVWLFDTENNVWATGESWTELVWRNSLGLLGGHWTFVLSRVEQADICILSHCGNTNQPSGTRSADRTQGGQVLWRTWDLHLLHGLVGVVGDVNIDADWLPVVIDLRRQQADTETSSLSEHHIWNDCTWVFSL